MNDPEALVHLRVPASVKGRWVRESRAEGLRLTDWLIQRIEQSSISPAEFDELCRLFGASQEQVIRALRALREDVEKPPAQG